jgi:hypothetical protein
MNASRRAIAMAACTGMVALHLTFPMMVALAETQVRKTDVAEVFCGVGSIWKAGAAFGYHCEGFDNDMDQGMNVFYANGLEEVVKMVGRVKPGGLLWISPDCSSFCGLCVAQTERSLQNPSGNLSRNCVKNGNFMAMVSMMLFVLGWMLGACPVLENPAGNWIWKLPAVRQVFEHIEIWNATLCRCRFSRGRRPKKAYGLAGPVPWIEELNFPCNHSKPHEKLAKMEKKHGKIQINGKSDALKESASYPLRMGQKVIEIWRKNAATCKTNENDEKKHAKSASSSWKLCMEDSSAVLQGTQRSDGFWKMCEEDMQPSSVPTSTWKNCLE